MSILQRISEKMTRVLFITLVIQNPWLLFIQQGLSKLPVSIEDAESFGLRT